jgi:hypothetical protein
MPKLLTPNLLDVPPTHPTRQEILQAFKTRQGVWTYCGKGMKREEHPWEALLVPRARKMLAGYIGGGEPDDPVSLIAGYCRLLEEAGLLVTGETELDAVQRLCAANEIVPPL